MMRNTNHSQGSFDFQYKGFEEYFFGDACCTLSNSCTGASERVEDHNFELVDRFLLPETMEFEVLDEEKLENNPMLMICMSTMFDLLCPRDFEGKEFDRNLEDTNEEITDADDLTVDDDDDDGEVYFLREPPSVQSRDTVEISPPPKKNNDDAIIQRKFAWSFGQGVDILEAKPATSPFVPFPNVPSTASRIITIVDPPPPSQLLLTSIPPPPPLLSPPSSSLRSTSSSFGDEPGKTTKSDWYDVEKHFLLVGLRPARRKFTGYCDIRRGICEFISTAPYKYQFIVVVKNTHPFYSDLTFDDFHIELEGEKIPGMKLRRIVKEKKMKRRRRKKSSTTTTTSTRENRRRMKRVKKGKNNKYFDVKNGIKVSFVREEEGKGERRFLFLTQFLKTSFHYCCKFRMIVTTLGEDESGNNGLVQIAKTDFFTAVARRKKSVDFRFWEKHKLLDDSDLVGDSLQKMNISSHQSTKVSRPLRTPGRNTRRESGRAEGRPKGQKGGEKRIGKKRKREMNERVEEIEEEEEGLFLSKIFPSSSNSSNISISNIVDGKRKRKRRKVK